MLLESARHEITELCSRLLPDGMVVGTAGNISVREGNLLAITPSGLDYDLMSPDLIPVIDIETGRQIEGDLKPASELGLHIAAYTSTGKNAVVHTHSHAATTVASLAGLTALPAIHYYICLFGGHDIKIAPYAMYGSTELADNVAKALAGRVGALMANHGSVVAGDDLKKTYVLAQELEWLCEIYLRACTVGDPAILSKEQIEAVAEKITNTGYGQHASLNN